MNDHIQFLFAPMEGITFAMFRSIHHEMFPGAAEYYTPFIAPDSRGSFRPKYLKELIKDCGVPTIPQLLVNNADAFNTTALKLHELGFPEINLNIGCPSGTVFAKHKGAGMLLDLISLDNTLCCIYEQAEQQGYHVSIKTRMGVHSTAEFPKILEVFNRYPVSKLIVHARCRNAFYDGETDLSGFMDAMRFCRCPIVYNGNIFTAQNLNTLLNQAPELRSVMLGRGAVTNPAIFREFHGGEPLKINELQEFHDRLTEGWLSSGLDPNATVERMKTLWAYWETHFPESKKEFKLIWKARTPEAYRSAVSFVFLCSRNERRISN